MEFRVLFFFCCWLQVIHAHSSTRYQNTKNYVRYQNSIKIKCNHHCAQCFRKFLRPLFKAEQITLEVLEHVQLFAINLTQVFYTNILFSKKSFCKECDSFSSMYLKKDSSEDFRGYKCEFLYSKYDNPPLKLTKAYILNVLSYTGYVTSATGWNLWEKKTSTSGARSVTSTSGQVPDPCPTVWRKWPLTGTGSRERIWCLKIYFCRKW